MTNLADSWNLQDRPDPYQDARTVCTDVFIAIDTLLNAGGDISLADIQQSLSMYCLWADNRTAFLGQFEGKNSGDIRKILTHIQSSLTSRVDMVRIIQARTIRQQRRLELGYRLLSDDQIFSGATPEQIAQFKNTISWQAYLGLLPDVRDTIRWEYYPAIQSWQMHGYKKDGRHFAAVVGMHEFVHRHLPLPEKGIFSYSNPGKDQDSIPQIVHFSRDAWITYLGSHGMQLVHLGVNDLHWDYRMALRRLLDIRLHWWCSCKSAGWKFLHKRVGFSTYMHLGNPDDRLFVHHQNGVQVTESRYLGGLLATYSA